MEISVFGFFVSFAGINPRLIPFRIFCFFRRKESVCSHAITIFWILPKKCTLSYCFVDGSQARSQPVFSGKPGGPFCLSCTFIFRNERKWMNKSARVSEKLVSPGLPGLQVATRLVLEAGSFVGYLFLLSTYKSVHCTALFFFAARVRF